MPTTFANTIDGNDIYAKRAECDAAGNNLSVTYATKSELPDGVPAVTSSDDGKVLKAAYSQGQGSFSWETESGGTQVQSDWTESDTTDPSYIQHKPTSIDIVAGSNVTITEGVSSITIAATDTTYSAGTGLSLSGTTFSNSDPLPSHTSTDHTKVLGVDGTGDLEWGSAILEVPVSMMGQSDDLANEMVKCFESGTKQVLLIDPLTSYRLPLVHIDYNGQGYTLHDRIFKGSATFGSRVYSIEVHWDTTYGDWIFTPSNVIIPTVPSAGNMLSTTNNVLNVTTTAGITDIQQVNALPANPVATVLYLIPET